MQRETSTPRGNPGPRRIARSTPRASHAPSPRSARRSPSRSSRLDPERYALKGPGRDDGLIAGRPVARHNCVHVSREVTRRSHTAGSSVGSGPGRFRTNARSPSNTRRTMSDTWVSVRDALRTSLRRFRSTSPPISILAVERCGGNAGLGASLRPQKPLSHGVSVGKKAKKVIDGALHAE